MYYTTTQLSSEKAPAGYGLGDECVIQDLGLITKTGWYKGSPGYVCGVPQAYYEDFWCCSHVEAGTWGAAAQRAYYNPFVYPNSEIVRTRNNEGTWGEWEWVSPPMFLGEEYRTTERYNGVPVYTKLVNYGTAVNGGGIELPDGAKWLIRHQGLLNYNLPLPVWTGSRNGNLSYFAESRPNVEGTALWLETDSIADGFGAGGYTWQEQLWYIKD